jgi:hypothetical protein
MLDIDDTEITKKQCCLTNFRQLFSYCTHPNFYLISSHNSTSQIVVICYLFLFSPPILSFTWYPSSNTSTSHALTLIHTKKSLLWLSRYCGVRSCTTSRLLLLDALGEPAIVYILLREITQNLPHISFNSHVSTFVRTSCIELTNNIMAKLCYLK